jgi:transposase-like protein
MPVTAEDPALDALDALTREYGPIIWRPISFLPVIAHIIDGDVANTADLITMLTEARTKPHVLDDAILDRSDHQHREQLGHIEAHRQQLHRWRTENPSTAEQQEIDRLETQNSRLRQMNAQVFALTAEIRKGTINRVLEKSDLELGMGFLTRWQSAAED